MSSFADLAESSDRDFVTDSWLPPVVDCGLAQVATARVAQAANRRILNRAAIERMEAPLYAGPKMRKAERLLARSEEKGWAGAARGELLHDTANFRNKAQVVLSRHDFKRGESP